MRSRSRFDLATVVLLSVTAACSTAPDASPATSGETTAAPAATLAPASTTPATTPPTTTPTTASTTAPTTAPAVDPTSPPTSAPDGVVCAPDVMLLAVDAAITAARLDPMTGWEPDGETVFDDRTNDAEEFRDRLGFDCGIRAVQRTDVGDRLLLGAWTGDRHAFVVQAADGPSAPYNSDQLVQLLFEQTYGEWLVPLAVWAGTLAGGETVVVAVDDYSFGAAAKAWQNLPRWEDIPVGNDTERAAIDVIVRAGGRNVSPAEPASVGSALAQIQFVTPKGLPAVAVIAPVGQFDVFAPIIEGDRATEVVGGVDVVVTTGAPTSYAVASAAWECGEYVWFIDSVWGTVDELVEWVGDLISADGCG